MKEQKIKKNQLRAILIHPEPDILEALEELADLDGRPLKVYVERALSAYVKEKNNPTQPTNH